MVRTGLADACDDYAVTKDLTTFIESNKRDML